MLIRINKQELWGHLPSWIISSWNVTIPPSHSTEKEEKEAPKGGNEDGGEYVKQDCGEDVKEGGEEGGGDKRAA